MDFFGLRTKVYRIDEGYAWVPRTRDFNEDLRKEIREIKDFGLGRLPTRSSMLQEVGTLPTLVLVSIFLLIFGLKMVERAKGLFKHKKGPKPDVLRLSEGVHQGEGGLCLGEPEAIFQAMFCLT